MAAEQWFKRKQDAIKYASDVKQNYDHAEIYESHASYVVAYCCPKNEKLAELHRKVGAKCQYERSQATEA
jgi:hypothetical protein